MCGDRLGLTKRATGTDLADRRGHRNTLRLFRMCLVWKLIHARYVWPPLQKGRLFDSHTSNIQRAQMKRLALCIVRSENPILRSPEGRSDYGRCNDKTHYVTICFSGAKRYKIVPAPFSSISFPARGKRYGRRRHPAPSAHPKWACGAILHRMAQKTGKGVSPFRFLSFQKAHGNNGRCRLQSRRRSGCGNRPWPAARLLRRWSYSRSPRS